MADFKVFDLFGTPLNVHDETARNSANTANENANTAKQDATSAKQVADGAKKSAETALERSVKITYDSVGETIKIEKY